MTRDRYLTVKDLPWAKYSHERTTGGWDEHGRYSQSCDDCGKDTTDPVEGAEAERFMRKLRGENVEQ